MSGSHVGKHGRCAGEAFVKKRFPNRRKQVVDKIADEITTTFNESLSHQEWMESATKRKALDKLKVMNLKVGYTTKFNKYPGVVISKSKRDYGENLLNLMEYKTRSSIGRLVKPRDKTEWFMNPHDANAYYNARRNEMAFPAGILQQPFFSDLYPYAMNYGSIGSVIGHEMGHGFDDNGRQYDKDGRFASWWSPASAKNYVDKAQCFVELFNGYKPCSLATHVNGKLTLGENLADTSGVKVAFQAFKNAGDNNSDPTVQAPNPVLAEKLTNHQLCFVAYAQMWCSKWRHKALEQDIMTSRCSPEAGAIESNEGIRYHFQV